MMLQLGMRTKEAQVAWGHFHRICHSGLCRTAVMGMRGEKACCITLTSVIPSSRMTVEVCKNVHLMMLLWHSVSTTSSCISAVLPIVPE